MKEIVVLSGKGGTGKTTVAAALAHLASQEARIVLADADVDGANLELVLDPVRRETHDFVGGKLAIVEAEKCSGCGLCQEICRFEAIVAIEGAPGGASYRVDPLACEGCAACFYRCPSEAMRMEEQLAGRWFRSDTRLGPLFHAHLLAGQENSGKLVTTVKRQAREMARAEDCDYLLIDGPPGIGCPVIAACTGADLALLVTEPTVAAIHDLERVLATVEHFRVPALVCINKHDLNPLRAGEIERFCASRGVGVVGSIPFDTAVTKAMVAGKTITEYDRNGIAGEIESIWEWMLAALSARV